MRVAVVRGVALLRTGNQRGQLAGRLRVLTRSCENLVGFAVALLILHVAGVEELKTAGHLNAGAGVAAVRIVAAIGNQCGPLIGPVSQILTHGVTPVNHTLRMQGRVLVEGVVALTIKDQTVRVVQATYRRRQVQRRVVAVFTNTSAESIQNLLCFSRQIAVGSLSYALLLFLLLAHVYPFSCKGNVWVVSSHHTAPLPRYRALGERRHSALSLSHPRHRAVTAAYTAACRVYGIYPVCYRRKRADTAKPATSPKHSGAKRRVPLKAARRRIQ